VVLGDSVGEMPAYYASADVALIGGSLLPFGGQNLIEACAVGVPVLVGPHTYNFADAAEAAVREGAALRVTNAEEAVAFAARLFDSTAVRNAMVEAGRRFCAGHQGAASRIAAMVERTLATCPPKAR
jgi:3-deoxy-D-manno-octulosonic-acid transferase